MPVEIRNRDGEVINKSRNLRGLRQHCGKKLIKIVSIDPIRNGEGKLCILFENGDSCETVFPIYATLRQTVRNWRNLYGAKLIIHGESRDQINYDNLALVDNDSLVQQYNKVWGELDKKMRSLGDPYGWDWTTACVVEPEMTQAVREVREELNKRKAYGDNQYSGGQW